MIKLEKKNEYVIPSMPLEKCLAKTEYQDGEIVPGMTVFEHSIMTAEVAKVLCAYLDIPNVTNFALLSAIHDIGKISLPFQSSIYKALDSYFEKYPDRKIVFPTIICDVKHGEISYKAIKEKIHDENLAFIEGKHHGFLPNDFPLSLESASLFGGNVYSELRSDYLDKLISQYGTIPYLSKLDFAQKQFLSGFISVSDWISSAVSRNEYLCNPVLAADVAVRRAGFKKITVKKGKSFVEIFGFSPNSTQQHFIDSINGKGIYILESETGSGKTEAALYAAYKLLENGCANGIYFALPTVLTSLSIFGRVKRFCDSIFESDINPLFASSNSDLYRNRLFGDADVGKSWFDSKKRTLLAPIGVGTIDQALMSVINVKHSAVRAFGLSNKIIIIDEIHSYDMYTSSLIERMIDVLTELGATIIVLSATLTKSKRQKLLGVNNDLGFAYPIISLKTQETKIKEIPIETKEIKDIHIHTSSVDSDAIEKSLDIAARGGYVLWIENTVEEAQQIFKIISARKGNIQCGLLHSRFLPSDREMIESQWVSLFGKDNQCRYSGNGKILVGTQVLEQSLDIDADFIVSRIAPIDLLIQRIGRLWRHKKNNIGRPIDIAEILILAPEIQSIDKPLMDFGKSGKVYEPYYLYKTLEVVSSLSLIHVPIDVRNLIEQVYSENDKHQQLLVSAKRKMQERIEKLENLARNAQREASKALEDDESALTRYSELKYFDLLLLSRIDISQGCCELITGEKLDLRNQKDRFDIAISLKRNIIRVPSYYPLESLDESVLNLFKSYIYTSQDLFRIGLLTGNDTISDIYLNKIENLSYRNNEGIMFRNLH